MMTNFSQKRKWNQYLACNDFRGPSHFSPEKDNNHKHCLWLVYKPNNSPMTWASISKLIQPKKTSFFPSTSVTMNGAPKAYSVGTL